MSVRPDHKISNSTFLLTGFPGLERDYPWLSIPFSCIYVMVLSGNCLVLHVIHTEPSLHEPMFYFLAMLALVGRQAADSPPSVGSWGLYSPPGDWLQTWFLHHSELCEMVSRVTSAAGRVEVQKVI